MKNLMIIIAVLQFSISSCNVDEYNANPNNPTSVDPQALLPEVLFNTLRDRYITTGPLAVQHITATSDANIWQTYQWGNGSFDEYNILRNITKMMEEAEARNGIDAYAAIGKVLRAHLFFYLTRMHGDIPYSKALQGQNYNKPESERYAPKYDSQKSVIMGILSELEEANQIFRNSKLTVSGDIIYNGNMDKWRRLANSYKLRILIMLSNKADDPDLKVKTSFAAILNNPGEYPIFENTDMEAKLNYRDATNVRYPLYQQLETRNKRYIGKTICDLMKSTKDERLFIYADQTESAKRAGLPVNDFSTYEGVDASLAIGAINNMVASSNYSRVNTDYYTTRPVGNPALALGYAELMFAIAEAGVRGWINADAKECYEKAITASYTFYGLSNKAAAYISGDLVNWDPARALEQIYQQRYLLFFYQCDFEPLFHYHRTGYPQITCGAGQITTSVPYRLRYPINEQNTNKQNLEKALADQGFSEDNSMNKLWIY